MMMSVRVLTYPDDEWLVGGGRIGGSHLQPEDALMGHRLMLSHHLAQQLPQVERTCLHHGRKRRRFW